MAKRIFFFVALNAAVIFTLSIVMSLLGIGTYRTVGGLDYQALLVICLVWGMGGSFISLFLSKHLAKWQMGVKIIDPQRPGQFGPIVQLVHQQAKMAGLQKMPEVGVYESPEVNAFATGATKNSSLVAVSTGLLRNMDGDAVEGVLAHEVSHIANGDMVTMTLLQGVVNAFVMFIARVAAFAIDQFLRGNDRDGGGLGYFAHFMVVIAVQMLLMPLGMVVLGYFSRLREFRADAGSAQIAGRGKMIRALEQLRNTTELVDDSQEALATLKIAGATHKWMALLSTHPPLEARIARLQQAA